MVERFETKTSAPVEKSRDSSATWMASSFAVWLWLFHAGTAVGFGSRKEELVDTKGDPSTIFGKIRNIRQNLPPYLQPEGFKLKEHSAHRKLLNPENGSIISGEGGDNIGRGGRTTVYFIDESAFIERPHLIEASLTANTDVRIDISSPRVGTLFNEWIQSSSEKFVFDLRDVPWHTEEWIEQKKADLEAKGMGYVFAQEYLRDPTAGIDGQLIKSEWIDAAVNAAEKLKIKVSGEKVSGMDVADGGMDRHALALRHGVEITECVSKGDGRAGQAGHWAYGIAAMAGIERFMFDSIGVGAGVAEALSDKTDMQVEGWSASGAVVNQDNPYTKDRTHGDMFKNAKAQAWWLLRDKFIAVYRAVVEGEEVDLSDIISLSPDISELRQLKSELAQIVYKHDNAGKVLIDKTPDGHRSPNLADSVMIATAPQSVSSFEIIGVM
jgi:phage terminase large subunit